MEMLERFDLAEAHRKLMRNIRSGPASLEQDLMILIDNMGLVTQEVFVNTVEPDGEGETPLSVACAANKPLLVQSLVKFHAQPTPEMFDRLIRARSPDSMKLICELLLFTTERTVEYAFLVACLINNKVVLQCFLDMGLPIGSTDRDYRGEAVTSLYLSELRDVLIYVAGNGDVEQVRVLDPCIILSPNPLFETLYLTAAFCSQESLVQYLLKRMGASPEAKVRAYEIMGARAQLEERTEDAQQHWGEEHRLRGRAGFIFDGDIKGLLDEDKIDIGPDMDPYLKALTIIEKHFRHRHEFQEALLMRPYTVKISIYTLDVIMYAKEMSTENIKRIWMHLKELRFDQTRQAFLVMKCIEWAIAAIGYLKDQHNPLTIPELEDDADEDEDLKVLKKRIREMRKPPVELVPFSVLGELSAWLLMILSNVTDYDHDRDWFRYMHRRLVLLCAPRSKTFSLLHSVLETHFKQFGQRENVIKILVQAGADMTAVDKDGNTLLHMAVDAAHKNVRGAVDVVRLLSSTDIPLDAVNIHGVSVEADIGLILSGDFGQRPPG